MKWIGQHIWDFISRFRNDVYLEDITESAQSHVVGIDSDGKLYKQDVSTGDITSVTAGTGLDGGGSSGDVSLSVDVSDFMANGSDNRVVTATGADAMNAETNLTFDGTDLLLDSTSGLGSYGSNVLHLKNSNASVGGPAIRFQKIGKTGADGDLISQMWFQGLNDADELTTFAHIQAKVGDASDGAETGQLILGSSTSFIASGGVTANLTGNASTATALETARNIGGVSFDGTANIDLPGVNTAGTQDTSGNAATATLATLAGTAKNIAGQSDSDVVIQSDGEVTVKLDSDNDETAQAFKITDNSDAVVFKVEEDGKITTTAGFITNTGSGNDLELQSDGSMTFVIDRDNDEISQSFSFKNFTTEVANLSERGELQVDSFLKYGSGQVIQNSVKVTLSTANCNSLHTTPVQLVPAAGANKVIVPVSGMIRVDRASTQTNSASDLNFHYADQEPGTINQSAVVHFRRFMYNETGDRVFNIAPAMAYSEVSQSLTDDVNKALEVSVDAAFTNNCFTSMEIYLTYNIFDIS